MLEVLHHHCLFRLGNPGIDEGTAHASHPTVALIQSDSKVGVAHTQTRMPLAQTVILRASEVLDQELGLVANGFFQTLGKHVPQVRSSLDTGIKRSGDQPELLGTEPLINASLFFYAMGIGVGHCGV